MKAWQKMVWFTSLAVVAAAVLLMLAHPQGTSAGVKEVILLASASTRGETAPCG